MTLEQKAHAVVVSVLSDCNRNDVDKPTMALLELVARRALRWYAEDEK